MQEIDFFNATKVVLQLEEREPVPWWFPKFYKAISQDSTRYDAEGASWLRK